MPLNQDNFRDHHSPVGFNKNVEVVGLDSFVKTIEKHFFSIVTVRSFSTITGEINIVVELDCNFELIEILHHFNKEVWGNFSSKVQSFEGAVEELQKCNETHIEIEEFSLFLKDTSVIINQIYNRSIPEQLENIITEISNHYVHFTKGLGEIPYEIYVPVFEDSVIENENISFIDLESAKNGGQDYFSFWGLYFYSEDDAVVYDLKNQLIIKGNLQMLNR